MKNRPWPIVVLAFLYFLGPIFNTMAGAIVMKISYWQYLHAFILHSSWIDLMLALFLYPIAGVAIFAVKEWSYPVYLIIMAISVYLNYHDYQKYSTVFTLPLFLATTFINVGLVSYFLIPAVRIAYFNKRLRWWESKPRYEIAIPAMLTGKDKEIECTLMNLSEGGAFISTGSDLEVGGDTTLNVSIFGRLFTVSGKIVHHQKTGMTGYGVQFAHTETSRRQIKRVAKAFDLIGLQARGRDWNWKQDFKEWAKKLITTGKGALPEIPAAYLKKTEVQKQEKVD